MQFAAVKSVANPPGFDQRTLASTVAFETSTVGVVIDRLEACGLIARSASSQDRRARLLTLIYASSALLVAAFPAMLQAQNRILAPLPKKGQR